MSHFTKTLNLVRRYGVLSSFTLLIVITTLSLTPAMEPSPITGLDKVHHLLAYSALTFPISLSYHPRHRFIFWFSSVWGGMIEIIQPIVGRQADTIDALVNSFGALLGIGIAIITIKALDKVPSLSDEHS